MIALNAAVSRGEASEVARRRPTFCATSFGVAAGGRRTNPSRRRSGNARWSISTSCCGRSFPRFSSPCRWAWSRRKRPRLGQVILGAVGIVQTIPALALLVLLIAPVAWLGLDTLGAGSATAVVALFLYSLLPIVRNTATGLADDPAGVS